MTKILQKKINKHLILLGFAAILMFGFGFALVPIYNVLCSISGLNGKTQVNDIILPNMPVDTSRYITVELVSTTNGETPAYFKPQTKRFRVHPGEFIETAFWVKNITDKELVVQAIPSVAPGLAGVHVKKQVCFCFQHQSIAGNQEMVMPLRFTIDPKLPKEYKTVTLAYTLFDVT